MPEDLARRIAIATGGMSGIGAAVADRLAEDGLTVVAADLSAQTTAAARKRHPSLPNGRE